MAWAKALPETGASSHDEGVPALVAGAVLSFGFVLLHPFMDGNGCISRFLLHHTQDGTGGAR
ncbi:Fic family protein [Halomonas salifodinae]|uniref:Fic family protein n=1 Tax=Halomonas salifodinae TaxID=438745 RepID=UPI0033A4D974